MSSSSSSQLLSASSLNSLLRLPIQEELAKREKAAELKALRRNADAVRKRCRSLAGFIREAWHVLEPHKPYVHGWHIDAYCVHLEALTFGHFHDAGLENYFLCNVPPGMMKSLAFSVFWPSWEWGPCNMPHQSYIATSYSDKVTKI